MDIIGFFLLQVGLLAPLRPTGFRRTVERPRRHARNLLASKISAPGCCSTIGGEETRQTRQPKDDENIFTSRSTRRESAHKQEGLDQQLACGDWDRDVADRPHANVRPAPSARSRRQAHPADSSALVKAEFPTALTVLSTRFDDHDPSKCWTRDPNSRGNLPSTGRRSNTDRRRSKGRRNSTAPPPRPTRGRRSQLRAPTNHVYPSRRANAHP
jgi:hypothetical protein